MIIGCAQPAPPPTTYPVTGKVSYKNGEALPDGTIQFVAIGDSRYTVTGEIKDGAFALKTYIDGKPIDGAVAGNYQATIIPVSPDQSQPAIALPKPYTVKAEGPNHFNITLDARR
jgi:hypothetical protein